MIIIFQHPWAIAILYLDELHCSGSILSEKYVLTAAHCFVGGLDESKMTIIAGSEDPANPIPDNKINFVQEEKIDNVDSKDRDDRIDNVDSEDNVNENDIVDIDDDVDNDDNLDNDDDLDIDDNESDEYSEDNSDNKDIDDDVYIENNEEDNDNV